VFFFFSLKSIIHMLNILIKNKTLVSVQLYDNA